jgi:hypothetical protein
VVLKEATMKRTIAVFIRTGAYLSPAAQMLLNIREGAQLFTGARMV